MVEQQDSILRKQAGEELGTWLSKREMSLSDFAAKVHVTPKCVRWWIAGHAYPRDAQRANIFGLTQLDAFAPNAARPVRRSTKGMRGKWKNPGRREQMLGVACPQFQKHTDAQILRAFLLEGKSPEEIGDELGYRSSESKIDGRIVRKQGSIRKRLKRILGIGGLDGPRQFIHGDSMSHAWLSGFRKNFGDAPNKRLAERLEAGQRHVWNLQRSSGVLTPEFCDEARRCEREFIETLMRDRGRRENHFKAVVPDLTDKLRVAAEAIARLGDFSIWSRGQQDSVLKELSDQSRKEVVSRGDGWRARAILCWLPEVLSWLNKNQAELERKAKDLAVLFVAHDFGVKVWVVNQAAYLSQVSATTSGEIRALLFPVAPFVSVRKIRESRVKKFSERLLKKGAFCIRIIEEVRKVRRLCVDDGMTVAEIFLQHPKFAVWQLRDELGEGDRQTFNHPRQWGPTVGYAKKLLSKQQGKSETTINDWMKAYRGSLKTAAQTV